MGNPALGITVLGSIAGVLVVLAIILRNGKKIHEEKQKKRERDADKDSD